MSCTLFLLYRKRLSSTTRRRPSRAPARSRFLWLCVKRRPCSQLGTNSGQSAGSVSHPDAKTIENEYVPDESAPPIEYEPPYSIDFVAHLHGGCYPEHITPTFLAAVR